MYKKNLLAGLLLGLSLGNAAYAAESSDPHAQKDDVVLPMPCGDTMSFRRVYTSRDDNRMHDHSFTAGFSGTQSPFAQDPSASFVQGGFKDDHGYYYLLGKYEVTKRQHSELLGKCPSGDPKMIDKLPVSSLSWFEAMEAARSYSLFLQKDEQVKKNYKRQIFARLPSDTEWEFAARGGLEVSKADFEASFPPHEGDISDYAWHQGAQSAAGHLNIPGRLKPNPLGIYDMFGNVQEMILEPFHAVRTGRLHGQSGGFCVRGGGMLTPKGALSSALRIEKPYFLNGKELTAKDVGYRLMIGTVVAQDGNEIKNLNREIAALGTDHSTGRAGGGSYDSIEKLDGIINNLKRESKKTASEKEALSKENVALTSELDALRTQMVKSNAERDEMRDTALISNLRLGGFLCRSMADEYSSKEYFEHTASSLKERCAANKALCKAYEAALKNAENAGASLKSLNSYYADTVIEAVATYDQKLIASASVQALKTFSNGNMPQFIAAYTEHLKKASRAKDIAAERKLWSGQCHDLLRSKK